MCRSRRELVMSPAFPIAHTPLGSLQGSLRGLQAHRRAGIWPDQVRTGNPQVSVARLGEGVSRVATDLLDPRSSEDLAPRRPRRELIGDSAPPRAGPKPKGRGPAEAKGLCGSTDKYTDTLLGVFFNSYIANQHTRRGILTAAPEIETMRCTHGIDSLRAAWLKSSRRKVLVTSGLQPPYERTPSNCSPR